MATALIAVRAPLEPSARITHALMQEAEAALRRGPYSVTDKTMSPPSGDKRDYFHPAPYFWPNPNTANGLPYVMRDGLRVPGTHMYEPDSERYDRTRLQRVFDDSHILTLAWKASGDRRYRDHAKAIMVRFFIDPDSRMTRHLKYAQVRLGHNRNMGSPSGLIEMKDFYYFIDAVRAQLHARNLTEPEIREFRAWLLSYLNWLLSSKQGIAESRARNNHGLYYDLQVAAIASLIGENVPLIAALARAMARLPQHFAEDGSQPHEIVRATSQHYCCFNLQGWISIARIGKRHGFDFWNHRAVNGSGLHKGVLWLLGLTSQPWPYQQIEPFDHDRLLPIWFAATANGVAAGPPPVAPADVNPLFHPHDGIMPFWQLS